MVLLYLVALVDFLTREGDTWEEEGEEEVEIDVDVAVAVAVAVDMI